MTDSKAMNISVLVIIVGILMIIGGFCVSNQ